MYRFYFADTLRQLYYWQLNPQICAGPYKTQIEAYQDAENHKLDKLLILLNDEQFAVLINKRTCAGLF